MLIRTALLFASIATLMAQQPTVVGRRHDKEGFTFAIFEATFSAPDGSMAGISKHFCSATIRSPGRSTQTRHPQFPGQQ